MDTSTSVKELFLISALNYICIRMKNLIDSCRSFIKLVHCKFIVWTVICKLSDTCRRFKNRFCIWCVWIYKLPYLFYKVIRSIEFVQNAGSWTVIFFDSTSTFILCKDCFVFFCNFRIRLLQNLPALFANSLDVFLWCKLNRFNFLLFRNGNIFATHKVFHSHWKEACHILESLIDFWFFQFHTSDFIRKP